MNEERIPQIAFDDVLKRLTANPNVDETLRFGFMLALTELREEFGYSEPMIAEILIKEANPYEMRRLLDTGDLITQRSINRLRERVLALRNQRKVRRQPRSLPAKKTDRRLVASKRAASKSKSKPKSKVVEEPRMTTSRAKKERQFQLVALQFMIDALGINQRQVSIQVFGDAHGAWVPNRLYSLKRDQGISKQNAEILRTKFEELFGFSIEELPGKNPNDFKHVRATLQGSSPSPAASKPKTKPEERAEGTPQAAPSPPPAAKPKDKPKAPPKQKPTDEHPIDEDIDELRQLLVQARDKAKVLAPSLPSFGGLNRKMTELGTWLDETISQWWEEEKDA